MPLITNSPIIRDTTQIADGVVAEADIADEAISLAKIKDGTAGTFWAFDNTGEAVAVGAGTSGQLLQSNGAATPSWVNGSDLSAVAGTAITANDAVYLADGGETGVNELAQDTSGTNLGSYFQGAAQWIMQSFQFPASPTFTTITAFKIYLAKTGSPTGSITMNLYAENGSDRKTGSSLGSATVTYASIATGPGLITFTLGTPFVATPGTKYVIEFDPGSGVSGSAFCNFYATVNSVITGTIANSSNSGSTYTNGATGDGANDGGDMRFQVVCAPTAGQLYKTDSDDASWCANFVGFAKSTVAAGATVAVQLANIMSGFVGLTPGATYFLNATPGSIGTSAGSTSRKIGLALTSTTLLIKNDNV